MKTWHIHIQGQVQGVGFRPYVFFMAKEYELKGWVNNTVDGVHIEFNAEERIATDFYHHLLSQAPVLAQITSHRIYETEEAFFDNFQIIHSESSGEPQLLLTPDFAICEACKSELHTHANRRRAYPFITCTHCGPRYSIITQLPYDRVRTSMKMFQMCEDCQTEYTNPSDRRYYAQTNSCPACSIQWCLSMDSRAIHHPSEIIREVVRLWKTGDIVAIKGIGGYLLTCDAGNEKAIQQLRKRKHRPSKPFAVMFPELSSLTDTLECRQREKEELCSHVSPIVLLDMKTTGDSAIASEAIAPALGQIGAMLPYTPLYELLLAEFAKPIIATSANISHSPIIFQDKKAMVELSPIAEAILSNDREIVAPQDDSVVKYTPFSGQKIIIRRSRGLAPTYINQELKLPAQSILAMGAMLKSTFSFLHQGNTYISQYVGDLEQYDTQLAYRNSIQHFFKLFRAKPAIILTDKHPAYPSTHYGEDLSADLGIALKATQHHLAHFGAILGEHHLLHTKEAILGVIWDGTGLGDDGHIWGGEFFKYQGYDFLPCHSFDYFDFILGDKMPKEPRISALSACWDVRGAEEVLVDKFSKTEWQIYTQLLAKENPLQTSSLGRIFDAVASLLGILDKQTFEGEAAMRLEAVASQYVKQNGLDFSSSYFREEAQDSRIPTKSLMTHIILDIKKGKSTAFIAAKFHFSLVKLIKIIANHLQIKKIAFSGGVFQNGLLVDLILHHLRSDFDLYFHQQLSPNDENISFGQLVCYQIEQHQKSVTYNMVESKG